MLLNLLPEEYKKELINEYRLRFLVSLSIIISIFFVVTSILLVPSYVFSRYEINFSEQRLNDIKSDPIYDGINNLESEINSLTKEIETIEKYKSLNITDLVLKITPSEAGITIDSFSLINEKDVSHLTVRGMASNRDTLVMYINKLKEDEMFESVESPISNFIKGQDSPFNIRITLNGNKNE